MIQGIDAHIHLEMYGGTRAIQLLTELTASNVGKVVAVSRDMQSCIATKVLHDFAPELVLPAYGFHPEQEIPDEAQIEELLAWMTNHAEEMAAVGEIGLPYYMRQEAEERGASFDLTPYIRLLDRFLGLARLLNKPVVLHAVYGDAELVCDMLEKHQIRKAHFHWFKGSKETVRRMIQNGYYISITPDVVYETEIQELVRSYPIELMMVETDGPWPFEGPYAGKETHPGMIHDVIKHIAEIKALSREETARIVISNTERFYIG